MRSCDAMTWAGGVALVPVLPTTAVSVRAQELVEIPTEFRPTPAVVLAAAGAEADPDRRIVLMLGARGAP